MSITAGLAQSPIQTAIYGVLHGDATLVALGAVYDAVPEATVSNYTAIGEWTEDENDTLEDGNAGIGSDCTLTLHHYTDDGRGQAGYLKVQAMASRAKLLLHTTNLTVSGYTSVLCQWESTQTMRDQDFAGNPKRHAVSTYRIIVEAA